MIRQHDLQRWNPCVRWTAKLLSWFPIALVVAMLCFGYYGYVVELCFRQVESDVERICYLAGFHFFLGLLLWSYYQVLFTRVSKPGESWRLAAETCDELGAAPPRTADEARLHAQVLDALLTERRLQVRVRVNGDGAMRICHHCRVIKADRCHHCSICGHCVTRFDHHCPWINTCVCYANYKFFMLFLLYAMILVAFGILTMGRYSLRVFDVQYRSPGADMTGTYVLACLPLLGFTFGVMAGIMFFMHLYLALVNVTTLENTSGKTFVWYPDLAAVRAVKRPFNMGAARNLRSVFGERCLFWLLPIRAHADDGTSFAVRPPPVDVDEKAAVLSV